MRWLLDPMHIEVNVTKTLMKHLYGANDNQALRDDCQEVGVLSDSWMRSGEGGRMEMPSASWVLMPHERKAMNAMMVSTRFPTGYGAKLRASCSGVIDAHQPIGLKSHDWHKLMHHMLPIALRACVHRQETRPLRRVIYDLSAIFRFKFVYLMISFQV